MLQAIGGETKGTDRLSARDLSNVAPFIDGRLHASSSSEVFVSIDPATGQSLVESPVGAVEDVDAAVLSARKKFEAGAWRHMAPTARKKILHAWADLVEANAQILDRLDALEMGKPVGLAAFNAAAASQFLRFNAEALDKLTGDVFSSDAFSTVMQKFAPRGVVAAIVPWNFPTYNVLLKVAPALAGANCVVLKPSELASQSAFLLARLAIEAGLPEGVLNVVPGRGDIVGRALGEHMDVDMVTFTGSTAVGKLMLRYAGASNLKLVSAECGGKSPQIVFGDGVDLEAAADAVAGSISTNQGQVCSVGSRLLVDRAIAKAFVAAVIERLKHIAPGDPQDTMTSYGPLASQEQFDRVSSRISEGAKSGATLVHGGKRMLKETGGYYVEPTVFTGVASTSKLALEEIFGPVLSVIEFDGEAEAIGLARETAYGLAAYVWTARFERAFKMASAIETGVTVVNATRPVGEGPARAFTAEPYGLSGVGPEGGLEGLRSYMRRQTVWFNHG